MTNQGIDRRKYPRLFLAPADQDYRALLDAEVIWPGGAKSFLYDLSYAGLAVSRKGLALELTEGASFEVQLRLQNQSPIPLKTEVARITEAMVGLRIVETSAGGRLQMDRYMKDQIVGLNTRKLSPDLLAVEYRSQIWFHGPFDTNIFIWKGVEKPSRWIIEYEGTVLNFENGVFSTSPSTAESIRDQAYMENLKIQNPGSSLDPGWSERVLRLLTQIHDPGGDLKVVFQNLRDRV